MSAVCPASVCGPADECGHCCQYGCNGGACEQCPCCCAGWCISGTDGEPEGANQWGEPHVDLWRELRREYGLEVAR